MQMVGRSGVGKTSILLRFTEDRFHPSIAETVGLDFKIRTLEIENQIIKVQLGDTAGQERFHVLLADRYQDTIGYIVVFDLTDIKSFKDVSHWLHEIGASSNVPHHLILIGNKNDLFDDRAIPASVAEEATKVCGIEYFETSALTRENVEVAFVCLVDSILRGGNIGDGAGHKPRYIPSMETLERLGLMARPEREASSNKEKVAINREE